MASGLSKFNLCVINSYSSRIPLDKRIVRSWKGGGYYVTYGSISSDHSQSLIFLCVWRRWVFLTSLTPGVRVFHYTRENCENRLTHGGNSIVFYSKTFSKSRKLILFLKNIIISFFMISLLTCSRLMKHKQITIFHENTKVRQNHKGSCYYYYTFLNHKKLPFSSMEIITKSDTFRGG